MPVVKYDFEKSPALQNELESIADIRNYVHQYEEMPLDKFLSMYTATECGAEFADATRDLKDNLDILDIGVGFGQSSLLLASSGNRVTAIEPSEDYCRFLDFYSAKNDLSVDIHQCTLETFRCDRVFDVCIFNASLHHCDDPLLAVARCHDLLKGGGKIFLINEQILKFYRSKKWYYRMMKENPAKIDHYGGNEHIYRYREYVRLLKKGHFVEISEKIPVYYTDIRTVFLNSVTRRLYNKFKYNEIELIARLIWYFGLSRIAGVPLLFRMMKQLSLVTCTIIGVKPKE
jgi:2-polyprenyl-3-methyl-5-hydroxy-6-metoxy-1,4-benzoquinol methylase